MDPGRLEGIPVPFEQALSSLEQRIMNEIVRAIRINGFSTSTADWQTEKLIQMGRSRSDIKKWVQDTLKLTDEELERVYSDEVYAHYYGYARAYKQSGTDQIPLDQNVILQNVMTAAKEQTRDTFRNMTRSMGFAIRNPATGKLTYSPLMDFYQNTLDSAVMDIASGARSYDKVLTQTINTMTTSGLRWIDYDSGAHFRVNVAARMAVMTGFRQVQGKINEQVARELGTDSYEVSFHLGARPTHQIWQGRVYTYRELEDVCGLGTVTGLHGANCYHDYTAFVPGVSVRSYTDEELDRMMEEENTPKSFNGKEYTTYEALQEQRHLETMMRKSRQDIALMKEGGADKNAIMLRQCRYQQQQQQYKAFSKAMKLPQQMERVYGDGLRRMTEHSTKGMLKETRINRAAIASIKYKQKLDGLGESKNVSKSLWKETIAMLKHRDGTLYEDLCFIRADTGEVRKSVNYEQERTARPTRKMLNLLSEAEYDVISIHNHPGSTVPSFDDIMVAKQRKYKYGLVAGHDGSLYKYSIVGNINPLIYASAVAKLDRTGYNDSSLKMFCKEVINAGIKIEVL